MRQFEVTDLEYELLQEAFHEQFAGSDGALRLYGLTSYEEVAEHYPVTPRSSDDQVGVCKAVESLAKKLGYTDKDIAELRARNQ